MPQIQIEQGAVFSCPTGSKLLTALLEGGAFVESPCSGRGTCGKCRVQVLSGHLSPVTETERQLLKAEEIAAGLRLSCLAQVQGDCQLRLLQQERKQKVLTAGFRPDFERDKLEGYGVAVDVGTTTVALSLVDLNSGEEVAQAAAVNGQRRYGLDVLTRISYEYEQGEQGIRLLQEALTATLNQLLEQVCHDSAVDPEELVEIVVAANCCMTHMLLGVDARSLGRAPYQAQFTAAQQTLASEIGLHTGKKTKLYCLPQVSAYIGGDIVAGAEVCRLRQKRGSVLFIDIGTNGEMVLSHEGRLFSCSCAAGPALEGMNISCGMGAAEGAVEDVRIGERVELKTIGETKPLGLCGSGILAAVRELVKGGYLKKNGAFVSLDEQPKPEILRLNGSKREAVLCAETDLIVTQDDVRQVQLAKGAILSGFTVLLKEAGLEMEDLDQVIVAGQFGAHLPVDSLIGIGLLPEAVRQKLSYGGNSSQSGAYMALLSQAERKNMEETAEAMSYLELAETADYERVLVKSMAFPHK